MHTVTAFYPELPAEELSHLREISLGIARKLTINHTLNDVDDLASVGFYAALHYYHRYDPLKAKNHGRYWYLACKARGAMMDELRNWDTLSRGTRFRQKVILQIEEEYQAKFQREPTEAELAERLKISIEKLQDILISIKAVGKLSSLEKALVIDNDDFNLGSITPSTWESPATQFLRSELYTWVRNAVQQLKHVYRFCIEEYYFHEKKLKEIADKLGITESRISQINKAAIAQLREMLLVAGLNESLDTF